MHPEVRKRVAAIAADRERGASELARLAIEAMGRAATLSAATTVRGLLVDVEDASIALAAVRPTMVVITNWVGGFWNWTLRGVGVDVEMLRREIEHKATALSDEAATASRRVAERAAALLAPGATVATCSHSATVVATLALAQQQGKALQCLVAESRVGRRSYGEMLATALAAHGVATRLVADRRIEVAVAAAQFVVIGADAVLADGSALNGAPSHQLAQAAKAAGVPLYVVAESAKFTPTEIEPEAGFERVPAELIAAIVTESGLVAPSSATAVAQRWR